MCLSQWGLYTSDQRIARQTEVVLHPLTVYDYSLYVTMGTLDAKQTYILRYASLVRLNRSPPTAGVEEGDDWIITWRSMVINMLPW